MADPHSTRVLFGVQITDRDVLRFLKHVNKESDCWHWTGATAPYGYGCFRFAGRTVRAHRFLYVFVVGDIPVGMEVMHKCDTPNCVRPDHMTIGTHADNMADMKQKGRGGARLRGITHCHRGHLLSGNNLQLGRNKSHRWRRCRTCRHDWYMEHGNYKVKKHG